MLADIVGLAENTVRTRTYVRTLTVVTSTSSRDKTDVQPPSLSFQPQVHSGTRKGIGAGLKVLECSKMHDQPSSEGPAVPLRCFAADSRECPGRPTTWVGKLRVHQFLIEINKS